MTSAAEQETRGISPFLDPHIAHREFQEALCLEKSRSLSTPLRSILTIELNITELCNRKCVFCPRIDPKIYPNQNLNMELSMIQRLVEEVKRNAIYPRFSFSGFGEPLLNKSLVDFVRHIHSELPEHTIEINTNGDRLTRAKIAELYEAGLTYLYINMYDGPEQAPVFHELMATSGIGLERYQLRPHWLGAESDYGLTLNNRSGTVNSPEIKLLPLRRKLERRCHYPFYKLLLDWNGDVLFCSNDWGRKIIVGNLMHLSLEDLWMSPALREIRQKLANGDRSQSPCNTCNVNGLITGGESFRTLMRHYVQKEELRLDEVPEDVRGFA